MRQKRSRRCPLLTLMPVRPGNYPQRVRGRLHAFAEVGLEASPPSSRPFMTRLVRSGRTDKPVFMKITRPLVSLLATSLLFLTNAVAKTQADTAFEAAAKACLD